MFARRRICGTAVVPSEWGWLILSGTGSKASRLAEVQKHRIGIDRVPRPTKLIGDDVELLSSESLGTEATLNMSVRYLGAGGCMRITFAFMSAGESRFRSAGFGKDDAVTVSGFHPILYVADPYAEREFFSRFGFATFYEGDEFPGFLAITCGPVLFGLSGNKEHLSPAAHDGVRWQLLVDDVDEVVQTCAAAEIPCEVVIEEGGSTHRARIAKVTSPNGVLVWFEGPNELNQPDERR